jgi:nucleoside-diphosphate-sugar epimerase
MTRTPRHSRRPRREAQAPVIPRPATLRVFVTGATGYLGSAIALRLARAGHAVTGMVRERARAAALEAAGIQVWSGDLGDVRALLVPLKSCDAVVHAAIDPADREGGDAHAIEAVRLAAQDGRLRRFLYTSGVWVHGDTGGAIADERSPLAAAEIVRWRPAHENRVLDLADHELHTVVLRPGMVYGECRGTFGDWFDEAAARGTISYPGDGDQHWGTAHRDDVAEAFRLALESGPAGARYLLVDPSRHTVRELAEAAARAAGATAVPSGRETPAGTDPRAAAAMRMDQCFTAAHARQALGWRPAHASFVAAAEALFREWQTAPRMPGRLTRRDHSGGRPTRARPKPSVSRPQRR